MRSLIAVFRPIYAAKIAAVLRLSLERIENVRAASLLHDIGKLDISRELLYKKESGTEFDPKVVNAFLAAFRAGEMEIPAWFTGSPKYLYTFLSVFD